MKNPCLTKFLRESGCDTEKKLRDALSVISGTIAVNRKTIPSFRLIDGRIDHS